MSRSAVQDAAWFLGRQASAAVFGVLLLALIVLSKLFWPEDAALARYDALFLAAVAIQIGLIAGGWETWREAAVILVFHAAGTAMELLKTGGPLAICGDGPASWRYPEDSSFRIATVPLFTGFMYAAIGSYIARSWRLLRFELRREPALWIGMALALAAYLNFMLARCGPDIRWILIPLIALSFWRARISFDAGPGRRLAAPVLAVFAVLAGLIWIAENIGTWAEIWVYPHQEDGWAPVRAAKLGSWFLLLLLSWMLVRLVAGRGSAAPP